MVEEGLFREDLWFRINMFPISIPPLRARLNDIPLLTNYFLYKKSKELGIHPVPKIASDGFKTLMRQTWPGNVRELENVIERALIQHRHGPLHFHQPQELFPDTNEAISIKVTPHIAHLDDIVCRHIIKALKATQGKISGKNGAAALLALHPNTLRNRMIKLGINFGRKFKAT